jgi:hypothetical protein
MSDDFKGTVFKKMAREEQRAHLKKKYQFGGLENMLKGEKIMKYFPILVNCGPK